MPLSIQVNTASPALLESVIANTTESVEQVGFDVVEIAPVYDQGISAIAAAKVMFEAFCQLEKAGKG